MATILLAEDDRVAQMVLVKLITNLGHVPIVAANGQRALYIMEDNPTIPLLMTDVMMPVMGGVELIQILRGKEQFAALPIIVMSAVVSAKEVSEVMDIGASWFMPKPFNKDQVAEKIDSCLTAERINLSNLNG